MTISTEELINEIKAEESDAISWGNRLFSIRSEIKTTKGASEDAKEKSFVEPFVIKRNLRVEIVISVMAALGFTVLFGFVLFTQKEFNIFGSLFILALLIFLYCGLYRNLTSPDSNYTITLTSRQIEFGDIAFSWDEIQETFIVYRPLGKGYNYYLIVGFKNGELERRNINNFMTFNKGVPDIANAIEHFKRLGQA